MKLIDVYIQIFLTVWLVETVTGRYCRIVQIEDTVCILSLLYNE